MNLDLAQRIISGTLAAGRARNANPLAVVVLDPGGNMVASAREDGAGIARLEFAYGKAWGSLGLGFGSRSLSERVHANPPFFAAAASLLAGRLLPAPGGVLVMRGDQLIGALGVSGDTGDTDEECAMAALEACGLSGRQ